MLRKPKYIAAVFTIILLLQTCFLNAMDLFPVKVGTTDKYGFINKSGQLIIDAQYEDARHFSQGFAPVFFEGVWIFVNESGINTFAEAFMEARPFHEGLAAVRDEDKWGYIDLNGKMVIAAEYQEAYDFSEGLACVQTGRKEDGTAKYGYLDKSGKFVIEPFLKYYDNQYFSSPGIFSEGMAYGWMPSEKGIEQVGFFDKTGKVVIKPGFLESGNFCDGLAPFAEASDEVSATSGFIKEDGTIAIPARFSRTGNFVNGLAPACEYSASETDEGKWGYVDVKGNWAIEPKFVYAEPYFNGLARVYLESFDNEAYIDAKGVIVAEGKKLPGKNGKVKVVPLIPTKITASSFFPPSTKSTTTYGPENLVDGNSYSAWIEGSKGNGIGEWVEFAFSQEHSFDHLTILNGYQKVSPTGQKMFYANLRPKEIMISGDNNFEKKALLKDEFGEQTVEIKFKGTMFRITILSVYKTGKEDPDCGFSEITPMGNY